MVCKGSEVVPYKITIDIKEKKLTREELKHISRHISEALGKMGFDHSVECHIEKSRLFGVAKNFLNSRPIRLQKKKDYV